MDRVIEKIRELVEALPEERRDEVMAEIISIAEGASMGGMRGEV